MKFKFSSHVTVSAFAEVEADDEAAARAELSRRSVRLGQEGDVAEDWVIDEADGEPVDIELQ